MQLTRLQWPGWTVLGSKRESEGIAIGTPARSERNGAADRAGWLGRYAVGTRRERGPHNHRGPHQKELRSSLCVCVVLIDEVLFSFTIVYLP